MEEGLEGRMLGRYRVGRMLGSGGMGAVYAGVQEPLGRPVAVKVLRPELSRDADVVARFRREAELAATLSHPNIAQVTDFGVEDGRAFLVMDLLEGESLAALIEREGPLSEARVQRLAMQILTALAVAHDRAVVHRDLKPENVFVQRAGGVELVKLLDFGIARMTEADAGMTRTGAVLGTPAYMSPEQARGRRVDARSDVFSLGAVLYEMLSGRRPFAGENYHELMFAVVEETPPPLAGIDRALAALVERAMHKTAEARFASAGEMRDALGAIEGLRDGATITARDHGAPPREHARTPEALAATMPSQPGPRAAPQPSESRPEVVVAPAPSRSGRTLALVAIPVAALALVGLGAWIGPGVASPDDAGARASDAPLAGSSPPIAAPIPEPMRPIDPAPGPVSATPASDPGPADPGPADPGSVVAPVGDEPIEAPAERGRRPSAARTVTTRCGASGDSVEQPVVRRGDRLYASSFWAMDGAPRRDPTEVRQRVSERGSAMGACYQGQPITNGQWYTLAIEADGHVSAVEPIVYCPIEPAVIACMRRALSDLVMAPAEGPGRYRVGVEVRSGRP